MHVDRNHTIMVSKEAHQRHTHPLTRRSHPWWYATILRKRPDLVPPMNETTSWDRQLTLTAALPLVADGSVLFGTDADALLAHHAAELRSRRATAAESGGLHFIASHRHGRYEFAAAAAMLSLVSPALHTSSGGSYALRAILLLCNNAHMRQGHLLEWLGKLRGDERHPPLRMLIHTNLNMRYYCGNLHGLAATVGVWSHFPWVLYNSGPDCMLTPSGAIALSQWLSRHAERSQPSFLGFPFYSVPGQQRYTMDVFVFWSASMRLGPRGSGGNDGALGYFSAEQQPRNRSVWLDATRWCLHGFAPYERRPLVNVTSGLRADYRPIPEFLLNEARERFGLHFQLFPGGQGYMHGQDKETATQPKLAHRTRVPHSIWHSHNPGAVIAWVQRSRMSMWPRTSRR